MTLIFGKCTVEKMKLVIVESPAKCNTIKRYLGDNYMVMASLGHVRDLATSGKGGLGVNIEEGFAPAYILYKDKKHVIKQLQDAKKMCDEVILATDPDREGEAIAWHLSQILGLDVSKTKRLEFHEITRDSIGKAMESPRLIDMNLVSSQETRRIVDRIIGFKVSGLIARRIKSRSAGRVQSATLKLIDDHDKEILKFVPEEYWNVKVDGKLSNGKKVSLTVVNKKGSTVDIKTKEECDKILSQIGDHAKIVKIELSVRAKESKEPFTTSTLQQEAFAKLKFKTKKTQSTAQQLYEGIDVGGEHVGLITYMRTDSNRLSPTFIERAKKYIIETFGKEYLGSVKAVKVGELSQDAHEAIRPTSNHRTPESVKEHLTNDQYNLYKIIYNRTLESLMKPKKEEVMKVIVELDDYNLTFEFARTIFKGYEILNPKESTNCDFPKLEVGDVITITNKQGEQKFTQPPSHYSEAKIVKLMEEVGIGRPSTYATTIETLKKRKYVDDTAGILKITDQGKITSHVLQKYFPDIFDVKYTASMEEKLDNIQDGSNSRIEFLNDFYDKFIHEFNYAFENMYSNEEIPTGENCPECGKPLVYKHGEYGDFVGCSNFPSCKYIKKDDKKPLTLIDETCPVCGKPLAERKDKKGRVFYSCSGFPSCNYIKPTTANNDSSPTTNKICPQCGAPLVEKSGPYGKFLGCSNYPSCNYMKRLFKKKK